MSNFIPGLSFESVEWPRYAESLLRITAVLIAGWVVTRMLHRAVIGFRIRATARIPDVNARQRTETLSRAFRYLITVVIGAIAAMLVLSELNISMAPLLGASGVVGLAIGFGSQSLVKDYFSGFFILLEDQIRKGDVVKVGDLAGLVEDLTLRHVRLRDYDGNVHFIPNNLITVVTNMSRHFAYAVIDIGVGYGEQLDKVFEVMYEVGAELRVCPEFAGRILEDLEVAGVERWDDSAVVLRCRFKVAPLEQWSVRREFLRRLKSAFDVHGVEIPFPQVRVHGGGLRQGGSIGLGETQIAQS